MMNGYAIFLLLSLLASTTLANELTGMRKNGGDSQDDEQNILRTTTWIGGSWYDYHGECDLVYLQASDFDNGLGLNIHARTSNLRNDNDYSYVESFAIQMGSDTLEVSGFGLHYLNGVELGQGKASSSSEFSIAGHHVTHTLGVDSKQQQGVVHTYRIDLDDDDTHDDQIVIQTFKDMVSLKIKGPATMNSSWYTTSTGLMRSSVMGGEHRLARDGVTVLDNDSDMGNEWQVLDSEPKLFQIVDRQPQYPRKCIPTSAASTTTTTKEQQLRRRLLGGGRRQLLAQEEEEEEGMIISREIAEEACSIYIWEMEACVQDVMMVGDLELAESGLYDLAA